MTDLSIENPPILGVLGGDCLCGRGPAIGTCITTASRLWFRAFHEPPAAYHLERATDWVCVDCVADNALAVATGEIRDQMRRIADQRATTPA
jgi:hypothetical protein